MQNKYLKLTFAIENLPEVKELGIDFIPVTAYDIEIAVDEVKGLQVQYNWAYSVPKEIPCTEEKFKKIIESSDLEKFVSNAVFNLFNEKINELK